MRSNISLQDVLDLGFEKGYAPSCGGKACLIRYADEYVACFEQEADARRFQTEMEQRLAQFDLQVEPSKTAVRPFASQAQGDGPRHGNAPRTFSVLGFTHYVGRSRTGRFVGGARPKASASASGNSRRVASDVYFATRSLFKWLNQRSQRRSLTWKRFGRVIRPLLPKARIVHDLYPMPRWIPQTGSRRV